VAGAHQEAPTHPSSTLRPCFSSAAAPDTGYLHIAPTVTASPAVSTSTYGVLCCCEREAADCVNCRMSTLDAHRMLLCLQAEFSGSEGVLLGHGPLGALEAV